MKCFLSGPKEHRRLSFWCPGCDNMMQVCPDRWHWDGSTDAPTLSPSILQTCGPRPDGYTAVCHCHVKAGVIDFCNDSNHALAGQTMPLPEIEDVIELTVHEDGACSWYRKPLPAGSVPVS